MAFRKVLVFLGLLFFTVGGDHVDLDCSFDNKFCDFHGESRFISFLKSDVFKHFPFISKAPSGDYIVAYSFNSLGSNSETAKLYSKQVNPPSLKFKYSFKYYLSEGSSLRLHLVLNGVQVATAYDSTLDPKGNETYDWISVSGEHKDYTSLPKHSRVQVLFEETIDHVGGFVAIKNLESEFKEADKTTTSKPGTSTATVSSANASTDSLEPTETTGSIGTTEGEPGNITNDYVPTDVTSGPITGNFFSTDVTSQPSTEDFFSTDVTSQQSSKGSTEQAITSEGTSTVPPTAESPQPTSQPPSGRSFHVYGHLKIDVKLDGDIAVKNRSISLSDLFMNVN